MTSAQRWAQIETLYDEVCVLPPEQRAALLVERTGDDRELLQDVQALLRGAEMSGDLLDRPAAALLGYGGAQPTRGAHRREKAPE